MNYIISEELRDIEFAKFNESEDWSIYRDHEKRRIAFGCGIDFALRNLTPVKSGGVVTREAIDRCIKAWMDKDNPDAPEGTICVVGPRSQRELCDMIEALHIPFPTPQPEARGVDISKLEKLTIRQAVECDHDNLWVRWPVSQQSTQGDSAILGGGQIEEADRRIMERSFEQLERKATQEYVPSVEELAQCFWKAFIRGRDLPMPQIDDDSDACNGIKAIHAFLLHRQGGRS